MYWFLGILLILLAALFLGSGLLAYAMYVLLGVLLVSRLLAFLWVGKLSATRTCNRLTAEVGERVKVSVTVRNAARMPVPWVLLEDMLPRAALATRFPRL